MPGSYLHSIINLWTVGGRIFPDVMPHDIINVSSAGQFFCIQTAKLALYNQTSGFVYHGIGHSNSLW